MSTATLQPVGLVGSLQLAAEDAEREANRCGDPMERVRLRKLSDTLRAEARGLASMDRRREPRDV